MLDPALQAGGFVRLLPGYTSGGGDIWAVYPGGRHVSLKVRLCVDHVAAVFGGAPARAAVQH